MQKMFRNVTISSECVTNCHPDKMADRIADAILEAYLKEDEDARTGIEVMVKDNVVVLGGEVNSYATVNVEDVVKDLYRYWFNFPENASVGTTWRFYIDINSFTGTGVDPGPAYITERFTITGRTAVDSSTGEKIYSNISATSNIGGAVVSTEGNPEAGSLMVTKPFPTGVVITQVGVYNYTQPDS